VPCPTSTRWRWWTASSNSGGGSSAPTIRSGSFWPAAESVLLTGKSTRTAVRKLARPMGQWTFQTSLNESTAFAHVGKSHRRCQMERRQPLRRRPFRRRPPDMAPVSGRPAASRTEWEAIQSQVRSRAGWRCQACGRRGRLDVHHVIKRSRGGSDFDLDRLVALCRACQRSPIESHSGSPIWSQCGGATGSPT